MMRTSEGYCAITGVICDSSIKCKDCEEYKTYKKERRYGPNEWD